MKADKAIGALDQRMKENLRSLKVLDSEINEYEEKLIAKKQWVLSLNEEQIELAMVIDKLNGTNK